jgi:hypothetical protein
MGGVIPCQIFDATRENAPGTPPVCLALMIPTVTIIMVDCLVSVGYARVTLVANAKIIPTVLE